MKGREVAVDNHSAACCIAVINCSLNEITIGEDLVKSVLDNGVDVHLFEIILET